MRNPTNGHHGAEEQNRSSNTSNVTQPTIQKQDAPEASPQQTSGERFIQFAVNTHGTDKTWDYELLASRYEDKTGTLQDVVGHIKQGHAICAGLLGGQRRTKANVIGSQWVLLDIDNSAPLLDETGKSVKDADGKAIKIYDPQLTIEQALQHPFIQQHCALIYTSASHRPDWHKFRLVFLLPEYESNTDTIEAMIRLLMEQLPHDPACKDASRVFYGNTKAEIPLFNPSACLPIEWREQAKARAKNEAQEREERQKQREIRQSEYQRSQSGSSQDTNALILDALRFIPPRDPGSGNYDECRTVLMALHSHFGEAEAERIAEQWSPSISGTTWNISKKLKSFKRSGVSIGSLFHIAQQYGWKFPKRDQSAHTYQESEPTITQEEWQWRHGIPNWLREKVGKCCNIFKGFGKPPSPPEPKSSKAEPLPKFIQYTPDGKLPTLEQYKAMGCPIIRFAAGQRLQLIGDLVSLRYHDILDSSATGSSKSHESGLATPERFGVDRLWYFSEDHRNPTTATVEANYTDMPVRNNGMVVDSSRRTALNNPYVRWPQQSETPTTTSNCFRTKEFHVLGIKGYSREVEAEASINPICASCHRAKDCATPDRAGIGASFRNDRREAIQNSTRIRLSINSSLQPQDLQAKLTQSEGSDETLPNQNGVLHKSGDTVVTNRNGAFYDEATRQLKSTEVIEAHLSDFDQVFAEIESKLPDVHEYLKPLRLALRPIIAGDVALTRETYHGFNDALLREVLSGFKEQMLDDNSEVLAEIIEQLKSIHPDLREVLQSPDSFNLDGVDKEDRKDFNRETSKKIRTMVRQNSYRESAKTLQSLACNWLIPFLEVWSGSQRGALRINGGTLTVTFRNTRHAEIAKAMRFNVYLDATASRENLALLLDIAPTAIVEIQQEPVAVPNLTIVEVTDLGLVGHTRSDSLKARIAALKEKLKSQHSALGILELLKYAEPGDGWWFSHSRGSNQYKERSALASFGLPYQNIGGLQDLYITLTGDRDVGRDAPKFSAFVQSQVEAEIAQAVGRLRSNLRTDEQLTYYSCTDFDLSFLQQYYPGAVIRKQSAFSIEPNAGTDTQRSHWRILQTTREFMEATGAALEKLTQKGLAGLAGLTQGRISQVAAKYGGWDAYKKLLAALLESFNSTTNMLPEINQEQEFIANTYLPLAAEEDPPDAVEVLFTTAQVYGWQVFQAILAATSPETRGRLIAALICGLPQKVRDEFGANRWGVNYG